MQHTMSLIRWLLLPSLKSYSYNVWALTRRQKQMHQHAYCKETSGSMILRIGADIMKAFKGTLPLYTPQLTQSKSQATESFSKSNKSNATWLKTCMTIYSNPPDPQRTSADVGLVVQARLGRLHLSLLLSWDLWASMWYVTESESTIEHTFQSLA